MVLHPHIKKLWVKSLRSDEYKQIKGTLRKNYCFCASGVLCDLYAKAHNIEWALKIGYSGRMSILGRWDIIPDEVIDWAILEGGELVGAKNMDKVVTMNDKEEKSFEEIADYIEKEM